MFFPPTVLLYLCIKFGSEFIGLAICLTTSVKIVPVFENPLFASSTPSNFWGRRWNTLIHGLLKRAVYKPLRVAGQHRFVAVAATFIASGLIHEYVWSVMFYVHDHEKDEDRGCSSCFIYVPGKAAAFFVWNGIVIILEHLVGGSFFFQWARVTFPSPIKTTLVILTALPLGHLFTGDWIESDYFRHYAMGLPIIVKLS